MTSRLLLDKALSKIMNPNTQLTDADVADLLVRQALVAKKRADRLGSTSYLDDFLDQEDARRRPASVDSQFLKNVMRSTLGSQIQPDSNRHQDQESQRAGSRGRPSRRYSDSSESSFSASSRSSSPHSRGYNDSRRDRRRDQPEPAESDSEFGPSPASIVSNAPESFTADIGEDERLRMLLLRKRKRGRGQIGSALADPIIPDAASSLDKPRLGAKENESKKSKEKQKRHKDKHKHKSKSKEKKKHRKRKRSSNDKSDSDS